MPNTFVLPRQVALDDDANPMVGALAYFYRTGTTELQAVYSDIGLTTSHENPLPADSSGRFPKAYLNPDAPSNYRLRITSASGVQLYQEDDIDRSTVTTTEIGRALYPTTQAEDDEEVTPTNFSYPEADIRRYGAISGSNCTTAVQTAMDIALRTKGKVFVPEGDWICTPGLSITFTQDRANTGLTLYGEGPGSVLRVVTGATGGNAFIEFTAADPDGAPSDGLLTIRDISIMRHAPTGLGTGLLLTNIGAFLLDNVMIRGFSKNFYPLSSLIGTVRGCHFQDGEWGVYGRQNGYPNVYPASAGSTVNLIDFDAGCRFNYNTEWGIDIDHGSGITIDGDIEANGTLGDANTGGVRIGPNMAPDSLVSMVKITGWFENNQGTQILVEAQTASALGTALLSVEIAPRALVASGMQAIDIKGCNAAHLHDIQCGPSEVIEIIATHSLLENVTADTITDTSTYPVWMGVSTSDGERPWGKVGSYTGAITGTTGQPVAATISYVVQGDLIELLLDGNFTATSNTTACTITGMPAAIRPSVTRGDIGVVSDNGTAIPGRYLIGTDGTITLHALSSGTFSATGFTASGTKGTATCTVRFKR